MECASGQLLVDPFVFVQPGFADNEPLYLAAKRYRPDGADRAQKGVTLVLFHATGSLKEQWEPMLKRLFDLSRTKPPSERIREAWCFDRQNHGDSAVLNRDRLRSRPDGVAEYGAGVAHFLRSDHVRGHRIIAIGHSSGTAALTLSSRDFPTGNLPYEGIVLIEAAITDKEEYYANVTARERALGLVQKATRARRRTWGSREEARAWMSRRVPWNSWDPRSVKFFVKYGLRVVDVDGNVQVTLKCDPAQEASAFGDVYGHFDSFDELKRICPHIPVHLIFGSKIELMSVVIFTSTMRPQA
ncbi:hypothetical protein PUNSTDRAFT_104270 [Punctularia strigosozonata HHB-11173 SS5]|uniref:uncharacterized protein n=1 Tax=Punctularia strigosozonata (strain HHB-11173) TaxID=741275 RepID=UPI0004416F81|nr:uncharacterized protein PUNSTDRAFT_104270 [Punctularia strigosozonata HHB-11173 SS5]EIN08046.1 hypothetical protein PUNSTDRAFT_104270 [Punctularia strigosozonata HHB-11173 SS5]